MSITFPLVKQTLESFAIHVLVIANLNHFDSNPQSATQPLQNGFTSVFNEQNQQSKEFWIRDASESKVIEITRLTEDGASSKFDIMLIMMDTNDEKIDEGNLSDALQDHLKDLTDETGLQIDQLSKSDIDLNQTEVEDEESSSKWKLVAIAVIVAISVLLVICCIYCCAKHLCGEKRNVMPTTSFADSTLMVDLQNGEVRERGSQLYGKASFLSTASERPLFDDDIYVDKNFMFYPGPKPAPEEEDEMDLHRVENYDLQGFMEEPDLIRSHTGFETYDYSVEIDVNPDLLLTFSSPKIDFQKTGTFPRCRNLTLYEKSIIHESALQPLEEAKPKQASIVKRASSLQDLARVVKSSTMEKSMGEENAGFKREDTESLFEEVIDNDRPLPTFEESFGALQKLEGRVNANTRTLPSRMRMNAVKFKNGKAVLATMNRNKGRVNSHQSKDPSSQGNQDLPPADAADDDKPSFFLRLFGD